MGSKNENLNSQYVSPEIVWAQLASKYKHKRFGIDDVIDWCSRMEREFISDVTCMVQYMEQPLTVVNSKAPLPTNLYRLTAVYNSTDQPVRYNSNGAYLFDLVDYNGNQLEDDDEIYIDYVGLVLDNQCRPMIHESHIQACEVFCKLQAFEEEYAMGKFNPRLFEMWQQSLPGLIQASRGSNYRQFTKEHLTQLSIIRGNMFSRIERTPLRDEQTYPERR